MSFRKKPRSLLSLLATVLLFLFVAAMLAPRAFAQAIPNWINYQGRLTSPDGTPVSDGAWPVTFRLYDSPTGDIGALWTETKSVTTRNGAFSSMLGQTSSFDPAIFTKPLWLEIEVNGRKLAPRQALGSVPFAMSALSVPGGAVTTVMLANLSVTTEKIADGAITEAKLAPGVAVPVGSVISWWGNAASPPSGWKVCDGTAVSDTGSPLNGQSVPDLRNRFVRGASGDVRTTPVSGGADTVDLTHRHTVDAHTHSIGMDLNVGTLSAIAHRHSLPSGGFTGEESGTVPGHFAGGSFLVMTQGSSGQSQAALGHSHGGATGSASPGTSNSLGVTSVVPRYVGLVYIIRVR
jgi:hypothetical protein